MWTTFKRQRFAALALACLVLVRPSLANAQSIADLPLVEVRRWTLDEHDLSASGNAPPSYHLHLEMALVMGTRWAPDVILDAARRAAGILAQCDIGVSGVQLREFDGPRQYRNLLTPVSREFARRSDLGKPAVFFVDDTLQRPAFDAEAVGRGNANARPEMADTVWITVAVRDLPVVLAHELVHVLTDSGAHSDVPGNLMRDETAPGNTRLTPEQCGSIVTNGRAKGLLEHGDSRGGRR